MANDNKTVAACQRRWLDLEAVNLAITESTIDR